MRKKALALVLVFAMALAVIGCGKKGAAKEKEEDTTRTVTAEQEKEPEPEPAEEPAPEPEPEPEVSQGPAPEPYNELVPVMTYKEFEEADPDSPVTVETYVQAKTAYNEETSSATLYAQDEEGAYYISDLTISKDDYDSLSEGQQIKVSGIKRVLLGSMQIVDATYELGDGSYIAEAQDVTDLLGKEKLEDLQNRKVSFKSLKSVDIEDIGGDLLRLLYNSEGTGDTGDDLYFNVQKGKKTYTFLIAADLCGPETEVYQAVENMKEFAIMDLEGYLFWEEGPKPHITGITVTKEGID